MTKTVGVVLKPGVPEALQALKQVQKLAPQAHYLMESSGHHAVSEATGVDLVDGTTLERESDLIVVFGGDGTLIHAASLLQQRLVPILGVNMGNIGFLTEAHRHELPELFPRALAGELPHSDRMRLEASVYRNGQLELRRRVLNDAVVAQFALARIATFSVRTADDLITSIRGDGVIVSTPTGSTAYGMAAGGSILAPGLEAVAITPICPHALTQRPLIVSPHGQLRLSLASDSMVYATLDGHVGTKFSGQDEVVLERSPVGIRLFCVPGRSYFQTLRAKLGWGQDQ